MADSPLAGSPDDMLARRDRQQHDLERALRRGAPQGARRHLPSLSPSLSLSLFPPSLSLSSPLLLFPFPLPFLSSLSRPPSLAPPPSLSLFPLFSIPLSLSSLPPSLFLLLLFSSLFLWRSPVHAPYATSPHLALRHVWRLGLSKSLQQHQQHTRFTVHLPTLFCFSCMPIRLI